MATIQWEGKDYCFTFAHEHPRAELATERVPESIEVSREDDVTDIVEDGHLLQVGVSITMTFKIQIQFEATEHPQELPRSRFANFLGST